MESILPISLYSQVGRVIIMTLLAGAGIMANIGNNQFIQRPSRIQQGNKYNFYCHHICFHDRLYLDWLVSLPNL